MAQTTENAAPAILLMGPTASGKTALAVHLARRLPVEIISVDSALVYRGMAIGTARPDPQTLRRAPHRLIDFLDPAESYSASQFRHDALREMRAIRAAGRVPLLVGGTMLYFRALERGLADMPPADAALRTELDREAAARGWPALHAELARVDPATAERLAPGDRQRIQRALEVYRLTGRPLSAWHAAQTAAPADFNFIRVAVAPRDRAVLHRRIAERLDAMFAAGFVEEVQKLHRRGDLTTAHPAIRAVGYRQIWAYLEGGYSLEEARRRALAASRQLAKRQLTWLRRWPGLRWFDSLAGDLPGQIEEHLRSELSKLSAGS